MVIFGDAFAGSKPLIGVIHLPPLTGYPGSPGLERVVDKSLADLRAFEIGGADGVLVENFSDRPFRAEARPETIAAMTSVAGELVRAARDIVVGVEILLNDPKASLAVAHTVGAGFMRTDFFVDPMQRPEFDEPMHIDPQGLIDYRIDIGARDVLIIADIQVKFARMLVERTLTESARFAAGHGADAIAVTGDETGDPPTVDTVGRAKRGAGNHPVLVGSGLDRENATRLMAVADGAIVGTSLKSGDHIDAGKVEALVDVVRRLE